MSGPKVSVYDLSPAARKNLNSQIRCEQQSLLCYDKATELLSIISSDLAGILPAIDTLEILCKRTGEGSEQVEAFGEIHDDLTKKLSALHNELCECKPVTSTKYTLTEGDLNTKREALNKLRKLLKEIEQQHGVLNEAAQQIIKSKDSAVDSANESIANDISGVISFALPALDEMDCEFEDERTELHKKLTELQKHSDCPQEFAERIENTLSALAQIEKREQFNTFVSISIMPLLKTCSVAIATQMQARQEFETALAEYNSLCQMCDVKPESYRFGVETLDVLNAAISSLEKLLVKQREQEYISTCVDEVMTEMGYDLIGDRSVTKRNGKKFRNELYSFNEGTAVNITYSSSGEIAMELGGIAREDRVPTPEETTILTDRMEAFCSEFAEIEQRLRNKGVCLGKRIAISPPTAEYAAIININDYNTQSDVTVTEIQASAKKKKEHKPKVLRKGEN